MIVKVFRTDENGKFTRYDSFVVDPSPGMTVLASLFHIRERYDESLVFRYSCRGAVCGTCAVLVNKIPRLACRTQLGSLAGGADLIGLVPSPGIRETIPYDPGTEVLVEPLPNLPVIRDLVVDTEKFFRYYRKVDPVFHPAGVEPEKERPMAPSDVTALEKYTNCILCAACFAACPVNSEDPGYLGPAALAKLYRFHIDPREARDGSRLAAADMKTGWWDCKFHGNCARVCPKFVPPNIAIGRARKDLEERKRKN